MIRIDRKFIELNIVYPSSGLVIHNPDSFLALIFQINITQVYKNQGQRLSVQKIESFPIRGIILPQDTQLIKISANLTKSKQKHNVKSLDKKSKIQIGTVQLKCSHLLEYNKQIIKKNIQNNDQYLNNNLNLQKIERQSLKIYVNFDKKHNNIQGTYDRLNSIRNSNNNNKNNGLNKLSEYGDKLSGININTIKSTAFINTHQNLNQFELQNTKLNEDFDLVRNKATFQDVERKKSTQLFQKLYSPQNSQNKFQFLDVKNPQKSRYQIPTNQKRDFPKQFQYEAPLLKKKSQTMEESFVVKNYKALKSSKVQEYFNFQQRKIRNKSIELVFLAIIAAIFFSLGSNIKLFLRH